MPTQKTQPQGHGMPHGRVSVAVGLRPPCVHKELAGRGSLCGIRRLTDRHLLTYDLSYQPFRSRLLAVLGSLHGCSGNPDKVNPSPWPGRGVRGVSTHLVSSLLGISLQGAELSESGGEPTATAQALWVPWREAGAWGLWSQSSGV